MAQQPTSEEQAALDRLNTSNEAQEYRDNKTRRRENAAGAPTPQRPVNTIKKAKGGVIKSSASRRADGIAQRGKTKGRFV